MISIDADNVGAGGDRKVDIRLHEKENSKSIGARPV